MRDRRRKSSFPAASLSPSSGFWRRRCRMSPRRGKVLRSRVGCCFLLIFYRRNGVISKGSEVTLSAFSPFLVEQRAPPLILIRESVSFSPAAISFHPDACRSTPKTSSLSWRDLIRKKPSSRCLSLCFGCSVSKLVTRGNRSSG